jgi:transposase-like protein
MSPIPRIARVPHTSKVPDACPHCGSHVLTRRGARKKKLEIVQLWRCSSCKRTFTPGPAALHNKTYPQRMILSALTDYDLGYSLEETATRLNKRTNRAVSPSTISAWLDEYKQHCSYRRLRAAGLRRFPPAQTIRSIKLYHRQVYAYAYHRPKLEFVRNGTLDDKRQGDVRFAAVAHFLQSIPTTCPHHLFRRDEDPKARASQASPLWADVSGIIVNRKENAATQTAALIIPSVGNNKLRHETLQRFMLCNDSVTIAVEIPIWLTEDDVAGLEAEHRIELAQRMGSAERAITGHIDFLQVRNGCVHVLDYKPDAKTNKPIAQLAIYALALTRRVPGLKLFDIKCAWFNEEEYCEIFPRTLFLKK